MPMLKEKYSYRSTPLLGLHGLYYGDFLLYIQKILTLHLYIAQNDTVVV